jgi:MFS family permease
LSFFLLGNARLFHLEKDLGLKGNDYQLCVSLLFVTYIPLELPVTVLLKYVGPRYFIPLAAVCWGVVSMCTGFIHNKQQLIGLRLLLGACEAGYFPGITFYLTFFYSRRELGLRIFLLFTASAVAGSCGGLLGYAIGHMDGVRGWSAWRWLMIIEGIPTILLGITAWFILANDPDTAKYLTPREKELTRIRRKLDKTPLDTGNKIEWDQIMEALKDWKVWVLSIGQLGVTVMLYGYSTFLPTIINSLGYSGVQTQLLTIPCYACGAIVYCITAYFSDKAGQRGIFAIVACLVSCTGYAILLGTWKYGAGAQYAGCIIVAVGLYVAVGIPITWMPNNLPSHYKRATGQGMLFMLSNFSGVISPYVYLTQDAPRYTLGHAVMLGFVFYSACTYTLVTILLRRENRKRDRGERDHVLVGKTEEEILKLGDRHPSYRYIY